MAVIDLRQRSNSLTDATAPVLQAVLALAGEKRADQRQEKQFAQQKELQASGQQAGMELEKTRQASREKIAVEDRAEASKSRLRQQLIQQYYEVRRQQAKEAAYTYDDPADWERAQAVYEETLQNIRMNFALASDSTDALNRLDASVEQEKNRADASRISFEQMIQMAHKSLSAEQFPQAADTATKIYKQSNPLDDRSHTDIINTDVANLVGKEPVGKKPGTIDNETRDKKQAEKALQRAASAGKVDKEDILNQLYPSRLGSGFQYDEGGKAAGPEVAPEADVSDVRDQAQAILGALDKIDADQQDIVRQAAESGDAQRIKNIYDQMRAKGVL